MNLIRQLSIVKGSVQRFDMKPGEMPELVKAFRDYSLCTSIIRAKVQAQVFDDCPKKARVIPGRAKGQGLPLLFVR